MYIDVRKLFVMLARNGFSIAKLWIRNITGKALGDGKLNQARNGI
jgi:hypothetical protein